MFIRELNIGASAIYTFPDFLGLPFINNSAHLIGLRYWKLDFWEEVEEGVDALAELGFDLFAGAFEQVHGDAGGVSVFEFDGGFADCGDFVGGEKAHSVDKCEVCHVDIVSGAASWRISGSARQQVSGHRIFPHLCEMWGTRICGGTGFESNARCGASTGTIESDST